VNETRFTVERALAVIEGDTELLEQLVVLGLCERRDEGYSVEEVELMRVARVLVRELDVNWPGVEVILRMRDELMATQRQMADLLELLQSRKRSGNAG
jgi:hypothetical protein